MKEKIVVISTMLDTQGIQQYSFDVVNTLNMMRYDVSFYLPDRKNILLPDNISGLTKRYSVSNNPFSDKYKKLARDIDEDEPDVVYFTGNSVYSYIIICYLASISKQKNYNIVLAIHDIEQHPRHYYAIKDKLYQIYKKTVISILTMRVFKTVKNIVLLSDNSYDSFKKRYPKYSEKGMVMKLVQHSPSDKFVRPKEMSEINSFYLCFGKIDKYKNVEGLIDLFISSPVIDETKLVIAGSGEIEDAHYKKAVNNEKIVLINRYIEDSEMNWLFSNCICIILPYIQATQSGVMTLAFTFFKPVIASNIRPFSDDIKNGENGFLFMSDTEFYEALNKVKEPSFLNSCRRYLEEYNATTLNQEKVLQNGLNVILGKK